MTLSDLLSQLRRANLFPIQVEDIPEDRYDLVFSGKLNEYIEAVIALQSPVVFVSAMKLTEEHFFWHDHDTDDDDAQSERVNLCRFVPSMKDFMNKIGQDGHIDLSVQLSKGNFTLAVVEDWMANFFEIRSQAIKLFRQASEEKHEQEEAAEEAARQHHLRNLRGLITDKEFIQLPTQRAMLAYALADFPELESLDERVLKVEIQNLKARIDALGLRRK